MRSVTRRGPRHATPSAHAGRLRSRAGALIPVGLILLAGSLASCGGGTEPRLYALEQDPMATASVPGASLVYEDKTEAHTAMGKPVYANITRRFSLDDTTASDAVAAAAGLAADSGWAQKGSRGPTVFGATKQLGGHPAELLVTVAPFEGRSALFIYLTGK